MFCFAARRATIRQRRAGTVKRLVSFSAVCIDIHDRQTLINRAMPCSRKGGDDPTTESPSTATVQCPKPAPPNTFGADDVGFALTPTWESLTRFASQPPGDVAGPRAQQRDPGPNRGGR